MAQWNKEGLPHKGWECVDVIDLAEYVEPGNPIPYEQCEMCGNESIRYAHIMTHPDFDGEIRVGCVCAEKMTDDYVNPRKRETTLKNRLKRQKSFNKVSWKFNPSRGTYSKKYKGEYITIMKSRYGNWGIFFAGYRIWDYEGRKIFSKEDAEKVAFLVFEKYHTTKEERNIKAYLSSLKSM